MDRTKIFQLVGQAVGLLKPTYRRRLEAGGAGHELGLLLFDANVEAGGNLSTVLASATDDDLKAGGITPGEIGAIAALIEAIVASKTPPTPTT